MTELEGSVLGVVWLRGPCTAYVVRREFLQSRSSHWSGSAGAIYPVLRRLAEQKLLRRRSRPWGRGRRELFEMTGKGIAALRAWMGPPLAPWTASTTFDPVRTRMSFLAALSPAKRQTFLRQAQANIAAELQRVENALARIDRKSELYEYLEILAVVYELRARTEWLKDAARQIRTASRRK